MSLIDVKVVATRDTDALYKKNMFQQKKLSDPAQIQGFGVTFENVQRPNDNQNWLYCKHPSAKRWDMEFFCGV